MLLYREQPAPHLLYLFSWPFKLGNFCPSIFSLHFIWALENFVYRRFLFKWIKWNWAINCPWRTKAWCPQARLLNYRVSHYKAAAHSSCQAQTLQKTHTVFIESWIKLNKIWSDHCHVWQHTRRKGQIHKQGKCNTSESIQEMFVYLIIHLGPPAI